VSVRSCRRRPRALGAPVVSFVSALVVASLPGVTRADEPPPRSVYPEEPYPPPSPRVLPQPEQGYTYAPVRIYPSLAWVLVQLIPSPEVAVGRVHRSGPDGVQHDETPTAFGLRWHITPLLWSWGTNRHVSRWRSFVVDPVARNSGSIELDTSFEYLFGHVDRALVRPGIRATFPLAHRGEYLSASLGTSTYAYNDVMRVAYDFGVYAMFGLFGVQMTVAPAHAPLSAIGTFQIRYF
jgi:hypothetical protein